MVACLAARLSMRYSLHAVREHCTSKGWVMIDSHNPNCKPLGESPTTKLHTNSSLLLVPLRLFPGNPLSHHSSLAGIQVPGYSRSNNQRFTCTPLRSKRATPRIRRSTYTARKIHLNCCIWSLIAVPTHSRPSVVTEKTLRSMPRKKKTFLRTCFRRNFARSIIPRRYR